MLEHLAGKGLIADREGLADFVRNRQPEKELPLYLRALVGVGAFIASLCFIGFLEAADIIDFRHEEELIFCGLVFVAGAIGLQKCAGHDRLGGAGHHHLAWHSFFMQSSFASMAVGKALFVFGMGELLETRWGVTLGLLIITGITYPIYRMSIDRLLSSFGVLVSVLANILWERDVHGMREILLNGFFLLQFAAAAILLTHGKIKRDYIPLSYAFAGSLCATVLFLASHVDFGYRGQEQQINPVFINIILAVGLVALCGWAAGSFKALKTEALFLTSIGALLLGVTSAPGILLAIGFMILGYAKHETLLTLAGVLLMPVFLWLYYYNLDLSLLEKSGILIGSGIVMLLGCFYLRYKGWDQGAVSCVQD